MFSMFKNFEGARMKEIYNLFWSVALSIILTNTLSFIDAAMVSNYDSLGNSAVTIANQLAMIINPMYFAIVTGSGIFTVQYFARKEYQKLKEISGISLLLMIPFAIIGFAALAIFPSQIVTLFTAENSEVYNLSMEYIKYYNYSMLFVPINFFFIYQYRAIKLPNVPLITSTSQAVLNVFLNWVFIFGNLGSPEMGISGAALATLISTVVAVILNIVVALKLNVPFVGNLHDMFRPRYSKFKEVLISTIPLVVVEFGFGFGNTLYNTIYSKYGDVQFNAINVARNLSFIINSFVMATSSVSGIVVGSLIAKDLKKDDVELRKTLDNLFIFMWICSGIILLGSFFLLPALIPLFSDDLVKNPQVHLLLKQLLYINGIWMSIRIFSSSFISILKSGNDNKFIILIDAGSTFFVGLPLALLTYSLGFSLLVTRAMIIVEILVKVSLGYWRYRQDKWIKKID